MQRLPRTGQAPFLVYPLFSLPAKFLRQFLAVYLIGHGRAIIQDQLPWPPLPASP